METRLVLMICLFVSSLTLAQWEQTRVHTLGEASLSFLEEEVTLNNDEILAVEESAFLTDVSIFPNQLEDNVDISLGENQKQLNASVYDTTGRKIVFQSFENQSNIELSMHTLNSGIYILHLSNDTGKTITFRLIKQ